MITGREEKTLNEAKKSLGESAVALRNDVGDLAASKTLTEVSAKENIKLDAVFINAGLAKFASLEDADEALWDLTFNTNIKGCLFHYTRLLSHLNKGVSIVQNGSLMPI